MGGGAGVLCSAANKHLAPALSQTRSRESERGEVRLGGRRGGDKHMRSEGRYATCVTPRVHAVIAQVRARARGITRN